MLPTRQGLTVIQGGRTHPDDADRSGRIVHDPRGNAVWDWALDTGVLARATVTELLDNLAPPPLTLELEASVPMGWDPYNRSR